MADQKPTEQANGKPSRGRRWWRRIWRSVLVLALVATVAAAMYVMWVNAAGRREAKRVLTAMQQRGLPTGYKELLATLPAIPPGEDGTRFYKAAMALAVIPEDEARGIPHISSGRNVYPERGEAIKDELAQRLHDFVERNAAFYAMSETALRYRCGGYGTLAGYGVAEMNMDALGSVRRVARLLQVRSLERTASGDADGAVAAMRDVLAWSGSLGRDPAVIGDMIRVSLIALASSELEDILSRVEPSDKALRAFRKALRDECGAIGDPIALRGDLALSAEMLQYPKLATAREITALEQFIAMDPYAGVREIFGDDNKAIDLSIFAEIFGPPDEEMRLWCDLARIWSTLCPGAYQCSYAEQMDAVLEVYDAWTDDPDAFVQTMIERGRVENDPFQGTIYTVTAPPVHRAVVSAAIDIEVYRIEHGVWPASLAVLPGGAPDDPFGGEPLRYKRMADGVIVYSVGQNRRDDGGEQNGIVVQDGDVAFRLFDVGVRGTIQPVVEEADDGWGFNE